MTYMDQLHVEIFIGDFLESLDIKSIKDVEDIYKNLHEAVDNAIYGYIDDNDELDYADYNPGY